MSEFLTNMMNSQRERMARLSEVEREPVRTQALAKRAVARPRTFREALLRTDRTNIIAEVKRSSPTAGAIRSGADVLQVASDYERAGAAAISVLTEGNFFGGSLDDLKRAASFVQIPCLRKDFIVDEHQVYEAAASGASALLLIVAGLSERTLVNLRSLAEDDLGMDALVEVHSGDEVAVALNAGAGIIGVNNRNLQTLQVTLDTSRSLSQLSHGDALLVAESGLKTAQDVAELKALGFSAFLIGEALMRAGDCETVLREMVSIGAEALGQ
jgi:indole-3-glycerol phosphate synthase